jgi:hypothetical protein
MSLSVGIVGLPNVGKSTLFNALLRKQQAYAANFPFATIEPNVGVVPVPDDRLSKLAGVIGNNPPEVPATVEFVDIAGLIEGASQGEGLGNKFLAHIRETDAICHVVRAFREEDIVKEGAVSPASDLKVIEMELSLADLQTIEKQVEPKGNAKPEEKDRWQVIQLIKPALEKGKPARDINLDEDQYKIARGMGLLTLKPILIVVNISEDDLKNASDLEKEYASEFSANEEQVVAISAFTEEQLAELSVEDSQEYLNDLGATKSGLERLIKKAFSTLGLITFLTAGEKEVRAWTIKKETRAQDAAGAIHNDFVKKFIKADVVDYSDFIELGGWQGSRERGKVRQEGREYLVKDGDVIEFKIGT